MADNYFLVSDDRYLAEQKTGELAREGGIDWLDSERPQSWPELADKLCAQALFAEKRFFLLEYAEMAKWNLPAEEEQARVLTHHANILVVVLVGRPDKRQRLYKLLGKAAKLIELKAPRGRELSRWVAEQARQLGGSIDAAAAAQLIFLAGNDLCTLRTELEKLVCYRPEIDREAVEALVARTAQAGIFDLVDAAAAGKTETALALVEQLYAGNADTPYLLQMLARQYRLLFQVLFAKKRGHGSGQIQKQLGVHPYAFDKLWKQASQLSQDQCIYALQQLAEADYSFKRGYPDGLALLQAVLVKTAKK